MPDIATTTSSPTETDLRYPIGPLRRPERLSPDERREAIDTPYRPGGWTVRQVVHHVPESHMNAYVRFKLAMTEDEPTIRPYMEDRWAEQPEVRAAPPELSLTLLDFLHERWLLALRAAPAEAFERTLIHPE